MVRRTRNSTQFDGEGFRLHNTTGALENTYQNASYFKRTIDDVLPDDNHFFHVRKRTNAGNRINGTTIGTIGKTYVNMIPDDYRLWDDHSYRHCTDSGRPSDALLVAKLLAETNPNRADVDIPTFIGELKDIPQLFVKEATHIKRLAGTNLKYQFGIKPLVADVKRLLNFQDLILKREEELKHLYESGLTRTRLLYKANLADYRTDTVHDRDKFFINANVLIQTKVVIRGHVRWKPLGIPNTMYAGDLRRLARKAALGMTVDFNTAYQLMPWSWLIDWCSNAGDILQNSRNIIPVDFEDLSLIKSVKSVAHTSYSSSSTSSGSWTHDEYIRTPYSGNVLEFQLPFLTKRQVSILGSIGVTRRMPRSF